MSLSDQSNTSNTSRLEEIVNLASWHPNEDAILDGFACLVCGQERRAMIPVGFGPRGQVFAHATCWERAA